MAQHVTSQPRPQRSRVRRALRIVGFGLAGLFALFVALAVLGAIIGPVPATTAGGGAPASSVADTSAAPTPTTATPTSPTSTVAAPPPVVLAEARPSRPVVPAPRVVRPAPVRPTPVKPAPVKPAPVTPAPVKPAPAPAASGADPRVCVKQDKNGRWRDARGRFCKL